MFVTPMISVYAPDFDRKHAQYSAARKSASRASTSSSDASSLHRTASTNSNGSDSRWSTSSISSADAHVPTKKARVSFHLPRPLQPFHKKALSQPHNRPPLASARYQNSPKLLRKSEPFQRSSESGLRPSLSSVRKSDSISRPSEPVAKPSEPRVEKPDPVSKPKVSAAPVLPPILPTESTQWQCSDLVVRCKTDVYHVDRTIMCYHSRWFSRVCAIIKSPKTSKSIIDLSADDSDAVSAMMQYCYQLDYNDKTFDPDCAVDEVAELRPHVDIYMLAERYGMDGLKRTALEKFEDLATTVLRVSGDEEQFLQAVRAMYDPSRRANADELRRAAVTICADHVEGFISGNHATMAMVFESMDSLPEFRADLFEEMALRWK